MSNNKIPKKMYELAFKVGNEIHTGYYDGIFFIYEEDGGSILTPPSNVKDWAYITKRKVEEDENNK